MQNYDKSHDYPSSFQIKCGYINRFGTSQWELVRFAIREYGIAAPNGSSGGGLKETYLLFYINGTTLEEEVQHAAMGDEARCNGTCTAVSFRMENPAPGRELASAPFGLPAERLDVLMWG